MPVWQIWQWSTTWVYKKEELQALDSEGGGGEGGPAVEMLFPSHPLHPHPFPFIDNRLLKHGPVSPPPIMSEATLCQG